MIPPSLGESKRAQPLPVGHGPRRWHRANAVSQITRAPATKKSKGKWHGNNKQQDNPKGRVNSLKPAEKIRPGGHPFLHRPFAGSRDAVTADHKKDRHANPAL